MKQLICPRCEGEEFHPIVTGTVLDPGTSILYDPNHTMSFTPTKRVFICIECGNAINGEEQVQVERKGIMYVVSESVSRASKELRGVGVEVSDRDLKKLQGDSMVICGPGTVIVREPVLEKIKSNNPTDLLGFDIQFLNVSNP